MKLHTITLIINILCIIAFGLVIMYAICKDILDDDGKKDENEDERGE